MITIFLDLDGVFCDFHKSFKHERFEKELFNKAVLEDNIFEHLDWMPNGKSLLYGLLQLQPKYPIKFEILSSLGSPDNIAVQKAGCHQKRVWLENHNMGLLPRNFVVHKGKKKLFATPNSILLDDTQQNIWDWQERGGLAVHYHDSKIDYCLFELEKHIQTILNRGEML